MHPNVDFGTTILILATVVVTLVALLAWYIYGRMRGSEEERDPLLQASTESGGEQSGKAFGKAVRTAAGLVYRAHESPAELKHSPEFGMLTLSDAFKHAVSLYADNRCLGTRSLISSETVRDPDSGRNVEKAEYGEYNWQTFREVANRVENFGSGLTALGVHPGAKVAIYADTSAHWQMAAQACFARGNPVVTLYTTLGLEAVEHGLNESDCRCIITNKKQLAALRPIMRRLKQVAVVITIEEASEDAKDFPCVLYSFEWVETVGARSHSTAVPPLPDDIAVIMYTSGSTGLPKGVLMSHANVLAVQAGVKTTIDIGPEDTYLAYLPLAHILELSAETTVLGLGGSLGYGSPLTLSDVSPKIKPGTQGDAPALRPTIMAAVPAIMDRIRKGVTAKVEGGPSMTKSLFYWAYGRKEAALRAGQNTPILNRLVFAKVAAMLGGNLRMLLSGGAPLSPETEMFMNICFNCKVGQGYGLTETCGVGTMVRYDDSNVGHVGAPIACCEIRLVDWEEGGYTSRDQPNPRGEIVIGGPTITRGYLANPEKTAESYREEFGQRWFFTGDIGEVQSNGTFRIIDRKKDLVKLQHGEYLSLGKVEAALAKAPLVENICVYADSMHSFCIAIVVPQVGALASKIGMEPDTTDALQLSRDANAHAAILQSLQATAKDAKLHRTEVPTKVILTAEPFTPENELVTASLKLKRQNIQKAYKDAIKRAYAVSDLV